MDEAIGVGPHMEPDPYSVAREIALKALDRRAYGRTELGDYLRRRGVSDEEVVERVLDRFTDVGLLDDKALASQWVDSRHRSRKLPRRALAVELRKKGIDDDVIAEALVSIDSDAEARAAMELAFVKVRALTGQPYDVAIRRLVGVLGRRGFGAELAWSAAKWALRQAGLTDPASP